MPKDHFAYNLNWYAASGCICFGMSSEIVRPQCYAGELSCLLNDNPGNRIGDRKNPLIQLKRPLLDVSSQTLHDLSRNEDDLSVLAALWTLDRQLMVAYIFRSELSSVMINPPF